MNWVLTPMRRVLLLRSNRRMRRNRGAGRAPDEVPEDINQGVSIKHVLIILIIGIAVTAFWRTSGHVFSLTPSPSSVEELVPNPGGHRHEAGRGRVEPTIRSYEAESKTMQRIITKYASIQRTGEKNETVESAVKSPGKTGTFVLNTGDDDADSKDGGAGETKDEEVDIDLDPVDLAFIDIMIEDIQETEESLERMELELRVNELERKLGRKLTKYRMTKEELDSDTTLDEDTRQTFEFRNVRQLFVNAWIKRLRELKSENYEKYYKLPNEYTNVQKAFLYRNFEDHVSRFWDKDAKRQKRFKTSTSTTESPPVQNKDKENENLKDPDSEIKEILEAIHFTDEYELKQEMEEELEHLKSIQGHPPPKVDMKEHIKNNFIYGQREKREFEGFKKKSTSDYSALEIEELSASWEEYFKFYSEKYEKTDTDVELSLSELEEVDDLIDAIEKTPRYLEREHHRKRLEELDEDRPRSTLFGRQPGDPEPSDYDKDLTKTYVNLIKQMQELKQDFIKEERAKLKETRPQDGQKSTEADDDDDDDDELFFSFRDYRQPEEYSLAEKLELKKRYDLFRRKLESKLGPLTIPREERNNEEISEALANNKLDYLDELIEDIHRIGTPAYEARLDVEAMTVKRVKSAPEDREAKLRLHYFQMRRKFIIEERGRLVGKLTELKTPNDYTFDEKEELRCRWIDFYERNWSPERRKEMEEFDKKNKKPDKKSRKKKNNEEAELESQLDEYESELVHDLIDEIYDQNEFSKKKKLMKEFDEEVESNWKLKEQLIRQQEGASLTPADKVIHEFPQKSLAEFLKMRAEFILSEKEIANKRSMETRSKGLNQFLFMPSDMVDLINRWKVKFRIYKSKVDKLFQTLGN